MNNFWSMRIPSLFVLTIIIIGIGITSYLVKIGAIPFLQASPGENPQDIRITNITDNSFTVTYKTSSLVIGSVSLGTDQNLGQVALDDRDQSTGIPSEYILHSITIRNLLPSTKYYYTIISGKTTYLNRNLPFVITTFPKITSPPFAQNPLTGKVQLANGSIPTETLVYVTSQDAQTLSTLIKSNGLYIIPLNGLRTEIGNSYSQLSKSILLQIFATDGNNQSNATIFAGGNAPVPTITLSNNYDFTLNTIPLPTTSSLNSALPLFPFDTSIQPEPKIETPSKNETFTDSQPLLKGKAPPNTTVQIEIHSQNPTIQTVTTDQYGNWVYRPKTPLGPGQHTITITARDQNGILRTLQQIFTIFPSGTQVAEAATPSATPTVFVTPTQIPTQQPTPTLTLTSTPSPTSTPIPSPSPTISTPTPTVLISTPSITPITSPTASVTKIGATGNNDLIFIGGGTLVTTAIGIVLFLLGSSIPL